MLAGDHPLAFLKINPMNPRTPRTPSDASRTPAVNPTDATPAPVMQPPNVAPETEADKQQAAVGALPRGVVPGLTTAVDAEQAQAAPPPAAAKPAAIAEPDPFILLWKHPQGVYSVRAMRVPGGVIVARAMAAGNQSNTALCFVPGAKLDDANQLVEP